jgi:rhomboid family GlyGly-CTERM serine protease
VTPHKLSRSGAAGPWASLLLTLLAALMYLSPELTAWATFDRTAIAAGELWRLITGHWTHWSGEHLGWDLLVFAVVGGALELRGRRNAFLTCTVLSALLISGGVWVLRPGMVEYRGLSGIDCALVTLAAVDFLRQAIRERQWGLSLALAGLLAGYLGKVTFEFATGQTLFVDSGQGLFVPVPLAHVLGGGLGIALGLLTPPATPLFSDAFAFSIQRAPAPARHGPWPNHRRPSISRRQAPQQLRTS